MKPMRSNLLTLLLAGSLTLPGLALAQGEHRAHHPEAQDTTRQRGMMGQGMMMGRGMMGMMGQGHGMMGMMGGPGPAMILMQEEALNLDDSQVQRLEALQERAVELRETHVEQMQPLRARAMQTVQGEQPDLAEYESALKGLAEHHVKVQVETARLSQQALDVLNPEQRSNVRYGMHLMRGLMQGGMMQGGMMGDCPMIGSMGQSEG